MEVFFAESLNPSKHMLCVSELLIKGNLLNEFFYKCCFIGEELSIYQRVLNFWRSYWLLLSLYHLFHLFGLLVCKPSIVLICIFITKVC